MAKTTITDLRQRATIIKNETVENANTALRVGSWALDTVDTLHENQLWVNFRLDFLKVLTRQPFNTNGENENVFIRNQFGSVDYQKTGNNYYKQNLSENYGLELYARMSNVPEGVDLSKYGICFLYQNSRNFKGEGISANLFPNRFSKNIRAFPLQSVRPSDIGNVNLFKKMVGISLDGYGWNNYLNVAKYGMFPVNLSNFKEGEYVRILNFDPVSAGNYDLKTKVTLNVTKKVIRFYVNGKKIGQRSVFFKGKFNNNRDFKFIRVKHEIPFQIVLCKKIAERHTDLRLKTLFNGYICFKTSIKTVGGQSSIANSVNPNFSIDIR